MHLLLRRALSSIKWIPEEVTYQNKPEEAWCCDCHQSFNIYELYQCYYCTNQNIANPKKIRTFYCERCAETHFSKEGYLKIKTP
jgi:hypothetical protein